MKIDSIFSIGNKIILKKKNEFSSTIQIGSVGVIIKSCNSVFGVCHFVKFKDESSWVYDKEIDFSK